MPTCSATVSNVLRARAAAQANASNYFEEERHEELPLLSFALLTPESDDATLGALGFEAVHRYQQPQRRQLARPSLSHDPSWRGWARRGVGGDACRVSAWAGEEPTTAPKPRKKPSRRRRRREADSPTSKGTGATLQDDTTAHHHAAWV